MERTYIYDEKRYLYQVTITGIVCAVVTVYSIFKMVTDFGTLWMFALLVAGYGALNTFAYKTYPQKVKVSDTEVSFGFKNDYWQTFRIDEIVEMNIRQNIGGYQLYIRMKDKNGQKARIWLTIYQFTEREDLAKEFFHLLYIINPRNLNLGGSQKMYARRPGQEEEAVYTEADFME